MLCHGESVHIVESSHFGQRQIRIHALDYRGDVALRSDMTTDQINHPLAEASLAQPLLRNDVMVDRVDFVVIRNIEKVANVVQSPARMVSSSAPAALASWAARNACWSWVTGSPKYSDAPPLSSKSKISRAVPAGVGFMA